MPGFGLVPPAIFGSVAPALLKVRVGSVARFRHSLHIKTARTLVKRFYAELYGSGIVGWTIEESRVGLHADRSRWPRPDPNAETIGLQDWYKKLTVYAY